MLLFCWIQVIGTSAEEPLSFGERENFWGNKGHFHSLKKRISRHSAPIWVCSVVFNSARASFVFTCRFLSSCHLNLWIFPLQVCNNNKNCHCNHGWAPPVLQQGGDGRKLGQWSPSAWRWVGPALLRCHFRRTWVSWEQSFPFNKLYFLALRLFSGRDNSGNPGSHSRSQRNRVFILLSEMLE